MNINPSTKKCFSLMYRLRIKTIKRDRAMRLWRFINNVKETK